MKRNILLLIVSALFIFASCEEEEYGEVCYECNGMGICYVCSGFITVR